MVGKRGQDMAGNYVAMISQVNVAKMSQLNNNNYYNNR